MKQEKKLLRRYKSSLKPKLKKMPDKDWEHINALYGSTSNYFYRDKDRRNQGYNLEHTMFTNGEKMQKALEKMASEPRTERNLSARLRRERPSSRRGVSAPAKASFVRNCANQGGTTANCRPCLSRTALFFYKLSCRGDSACEKEIRS